MQKAPILLFIICFIVQQSLYAPIKNNLTGTSYSRIEDQKTAIYKERTPWVSIYKSMRAEPRTDIISLYFQYVLPVDLLTQTLGTNSTLTQGNAMMKLEAGTELTVTSTITTKKAINYSPGHEVSSFFTAMFPTPGATGGHLTRYIGMFTANDGMAIGTRNSTFGILYLQNGTATFTPQTSFNIDKLDGSGPSGFVIDITKINVYYIAFGWLGAAPLEFGVATEDGDWVPFHRIRYPNLYTTPSTFNPSLPLAMAVSKDGSDNGTLNIQTASWDAAITGEEHSARTFTVAKDDKTISGSTIVPIISLKNKTTYAHQKNTARMRLLYMNISGYNTGNQMRLQIYKEPTLSGDSFNNVDNMLSVAQSDTTATSYTATGTMLFQTSVYSQGDANIFLKSNGIPIEIYPGETLSVGGSESGSGGVTMDVSLTWEEFL